MNNFSTWLAVVMLAIFTTMVGISLTYPAGARFMPLVVGLPGIALCLLQLLQDYLTARGGKLAHSFHPQPQAGVPPVDPADLPEYGPHTVRNELVMGAYFVSFMAGVLLFGFNIAIPIMVAAYLHFEAKVRTLLAIAAGALTVGVVWFLFEHTLRFRMHEGFITAWVIKSLGM